jgi:DNA-binding transcriptional ArsR family regulator
MRKSQIDAILNKTKQDILSKTLLNPEKWWYLSDLAKNIGTSPSTLQRDLAALVKADILELRKDGNRTYYKANDNCPLLIDLQNLLLKTTGLRDVIFRVLNKYSEKIAISFIYGSIARGEALSKSDVDILIVGEVKISELVKDLKLCENELGREVNPVIYTEKDFNSQIKGKNNFVLTILEKEKIFLIGDINELERLVKQESDSAA